jgi:hypothetical protein
MDGSIIKMIKTYHPALKQQGIKRAKTRHDLLDVHAKEFHPSLSLLTEVERDFLKLLEQKRE